MNDANKFIYPFEFFSLLWPSISQQLSSVDAATQSPTSRNAMLINCAFLSVAYLVFCKIVKSVLLRKGYRAYICNASVIYLWNFSFAVASTLFFVAYYARRLYSHLGKHCVPLFPTYEPELVVRTLNNPLFEWTSNVLTAYYLTATLFSLQEQDYAEACTKFLYVLVLNSLHANGFEIYMVLLNIGVGLFNMSTDFFYAFALISNSSNDKLLMLLMYGRIGFWSVACLHMIPFWYLIPMLYATNFSLWLNACLWMWYGANVWNSPILHYYYHQFYHQYESCNNSAARCVLIRNSAEYQHYTNLQQAYMEIQLANHKKAGLPDATGSANASARAFQTLKAMMMLKKKLKRIRERAATQSAVSGVALT